ncbi:uncharacterized protein LOC121705680 isoform X1 [Alosa sapidissima]|uniref:uncharacterized protein LOC121705680 isoform X1 n=1 Tax=Alosa sapidissima TaxID=34773 RepID=UPI001C08E6A5|nr:uncharacterized protein LOC121705680 isoform X1 [Alosa sapidissima]
MDGRRRKYVAPDSKYEIPSRTRRYWKRRKLVEAINMHLSKQGMYNHESSDLDSDNGSEDGHDGGGITQNLDQESSDNRSEDAHDGDDITSLHTDPESEELPPNLSQTTESSIFSFEDSVDLGVFEPLWQTHQGQHCPQKSITDSESIGSGEEFPMEDSTDKSVNEESHLGVDVNERLPPVNDEPLYTGSQLTKAQSFFTYTFICFETLTYWCGPV